MRACIAHRASISSVLSVPFFGKEKIAMECDLCKQEPPVSGSLLCATCAEAIRRLLAISQDASARDGVSFDCKSGAYKTSCGTFVRDR
jgi:hypothetical protein